MQATWYRISTGLNTDAKPGTVSLFFDYNLCNWTFGSSIEPDPCWISLHIVLGPIDLSLTYWR